MPLVPLTPQVDIAEWANRQQRAFERLVVDDDDGIHAPVTTIERRLPDFVTNRAAGAHIKSLRLAEQAMCVFADDGIQIPWSAIEETATVLSGLPDAVREELGVDGARDGDEALDRLQAKFGNVPQDQFANTKHLLVADMVDLERPFAPGAFQPTMYMLKQQLDSSGQPTAPKPSSGPADDIVQEVVDLVLCFAHGDWGPLVDLPWPAKKLGWAAGWTCCLDRVCANAVADILLGFGGGSELLKLLKGGVSEMVGLGAKTLALTAGLALAIYGAVLGYNIKKVNTAKGACLHGNWPTPLLGAFVWATGW